MTAAEIGAGIRVREPASWYLAVVVELAARDHFARHRVLGRRVSHHRALQLTRLDALLDDQLQIVAQRQLHRLRQLAAPVYFTDAHRGA